MIQKAKQYCVFVWTIGCLSSTTNSAFQPRRTARRIVTPLFAQVSSNPSAVEELHPAVAGWPEKYQGSALSTSGKGPRILHSDFTVVRASEKALEDLDVANWPTWTTSDKDKWAVGNQNADKIMPYGELSYMISGKLEIVLPSGEQVIIEPGQFVTFPKGFQSSWRVLEELTWHYYLY